MCQGTPGPRSHCPRPLLSTHLSCCWAQGHPAAPGWAAGIGSEPHTPCDARWPRPCPTPAPFLGSDKPAVLRAGSLGQPSGQHPPTPPPFLSIEQVGWTQPCELTDRYHSRGEVLKVTKLYLKVAEMVNFSKVSFTIHTRTKAQKTHLQEPHKATGEGCWGAGEQDSHKPCP